MNKRIEEKILEIEKYIEELSTISPDSFEHYKSSIEKKAACERYIEKIVEGITDLAFYVIKSKKLKIPIDDADAFTILLENKIIDINISKKMKSAKGMRNVIAHQYSNIDDEIIYHSIKEELGNDTKEFIEKIKQSIKM